MTRRFALSTRARSQSCSSVRSLLSRSPEEHFAGRRGQGALTEKVILFAVRRDAARTSSTSTRAQGVDADDGRAHGPGHRRARTACSRASRRTPVSAGRLSPPERGPATTARRTTRSTTRERRSRPARRASRPRGYSRRTRSPRPQSEPGKTVVAMEWVAAQGLRAVATGARRRLPDLHRRPRDHSQLRHPRQPRLELRGPVSAARARSRRVGGRTCRPRSAPRRRRCSRTTAVRSPQAVSGTSTSTTRRTTQRSTTTTCSS